MGLMGKLHQQYSKKECLLIDLARQVMVSFHQKEFLTNKEPLHYIDSDEADYYIYRVLEDFEVTGGKIAPWFDRPGGGTQYIKYHSNGKAYSMEELEETELIEFVSVKKGG